MDNKKTYIKFRCDMDDIDNPNSLVYMLYNGKTDIIGVMGVEKMNKYGEQIKTHLHFHFETEEKVETIRKRFVRANEKKKNYSLKMETDVVDLDRFYRYPLKQYDPAEFKYLYKFTLPENFDMKLQQLLAYEEWNKGKEILTKHAVKRDSRLSVYERILEKLDTEGVKFDNLQDIKYYIFDYYMDNKLPLQKQKMLDMVNGVAAFHGVISKYDFFN